MAGAQKSYNDPIKKTYKKSTHTWKHKKTDLLAIAIIAWYISFFVD